MAVQRVKIVGGWSGGPLGSREPGDPDFDYDVRADPQDLVKLGLVEPVKAAEPATRKD